MSLTIKTSPSTRYSAFGDLLFVVFDDVKPADPVTYPDFKYVADVYVGTDLVARLKAYPRPDNKMGIFNIGNIVRNYIAAVFDPTAAAVQAQLLDDGEFKIDVTMKFGDEVNFVMTTDITVDSARTYFGHYNGREIGQNTILGDYYNLPLTLRPLTTPVSRTSDFNLVPFFATDAGVSIQVKKYDASNNLLGTYNYSLLSGANEVCKVYNLSPTGINGGSPGFIDSSVEYYTCQFNPSSGPTYRFNVVCDPTFTVYTLHFLNKFGGFESKSFNKLSRKSVDIEKQEYGRLPYTVDASGVVSYYNANKVYGETRSVYSSQYKEKMVLNSDNLTDGEYTWLGDLVLSPLVYMEVSGYFIPIVIISSNYEYNKSVNKRISNLTLNIEFGDQFNAQYR